MDDLRLTLAALLVLVAACPAGDDGAQGETSEGMTSGEAMTEPTTGASMTGVEPTASTTVEPTTEPMTTSQMTMSTTVPTTTEPPPTTTEATDTGEPMCAEPDPSVDAVFVVDVGDWPFDTEYTLDLEAQCTIAALTVGATIDLELACDDDGTPRTVSVSVPATNEGAPSWPVDLAVSLDYRFHEKWELENRIVQRVAIREAASGDLLLAAADTGQLDPSKLNPFGPDVAPLGLAEELLFDCGGGAYDVPLELTFSLEGDELALQAGQRGTLPIDADVYAIDLATANGVDPDEPSDAIPGHIELVVRRVTP